MKVLLLELNYITVLGVVLKVTQVDNDYIYASIFIKPRGRNFRVINLFLSNKNCDILCTHKSKHLRTDKSSTESKLNVGNVIPLMQKLYL